MTDGSLPAGVKWLCGDGRIFGQADVGPGLRLENIPVRDLMCSLALGLNKGCIADERR